MMQKITSENDLIVGEWYWVNCDLEYPWSAMHMVSKGFASHVWTAFGNNPIYHCPTPDTASQEVERLRNCLERFVGMPNHFEEYGTAEEALTHNAELAKT